MKKLIAIFTIALSMSAMASNPYEPEQVFVFDHYKSVVKQVPYDVEVCKQVRQNTGSGDGSATNEIIGAIFGGAIGNQFGEGDGKDAMTLAGIFLGASIANDAEKANSTGQVVVRQEVCENKVRQKIEKRLSHYKINVEYEGRDLSFTSKKRPYDDVIKVKVSVDLLD